MSNKRQVFKLHKPLLAKKHLFLVIPVISLVGVLSILFFKHTFVVAQNVTQGLTVSPPSQEVAIDPGGTTTIKAKITNKSNATLPINVSVEDFTAKGDEGQVELTTDSKYSVASWTKLSATSFSLAPGEAKEVTATIRAPRDAAGGRFGSFVFAVKPQNQPGTASLSQEIASLFLVKVSGPVDEKLSISSFSAPAFSEFGPVPFGIKFTNGGNVYSKPTGLINVTDMFGNKVADIVVPGVNIFPGADRIITASLNKPFIIGQYKATALMYYGASNQVLTSTTTFIVFPTRIAAIIVVVLLFIFLIRKRLGKSMKALFG